MLMAQINVVVDPVILMQLVEVLQSSCYNEIEYDKWFIQIFLFFKTSKLFNY